ncbi:tRNA1(Val) (adenine(37)-N6)-methyltransferase, partial [Bacteroidota bacterium]
MAEPYFQFKKFRVYHNSCGFKVGTDGVLLGAWAPVRGGDDILDIGTGSGLIALMLAQRAKDATVDAIDINDYAAHQAASNFAKSPFSNIRAHRSTVANWAAGSKRYDLVVCNPPFFMNAPEPKSQSLKVAKHCVSLSPSDLFKHVKTLLKPGGRFALIFPKLEYDNFCGAAKEYNFYPKDVLDVSPLPNYP